MKRDDVVENCRLYFIMMELISLKFRSISLQLIDFQWDDQPQQSQSGVIVRISSFIVITDKGSNQETYNRKPQ